MFFKSRGEGRFFVKKKLAFICGLTFLSLSLVANSYDKVFTLQLSQNFPVMHPQLVYESTSMQVVTAISEGLFTYDPYSALPIKGLAEKYSVAGKTWRFFLRKDARFENGEPITAEVLKKSWMNLLVPGTEFPYASLLDCIQGAKDYRCGKNSKPESVAIYVEGKYELAVYLNEPVPHFPSVLCNPAFAPIHPTQLEYARKHTVSPKEITEKNAFVPISSGPFKIAEYNKNRITFVKNEKYWDANSVGLKKIVLRMDLSEDEQSEHFNRGELIWTKEAALDKVVGTQVISYTPMFSTSFFFFNARDKNVSCEKVRKALLFATPYKKLREKFYLPAKSLVFPLAGYPEVCSVDEQNINQARKLLRELQLKDSEKILTIKVYDYEFSKNLANILKEAWEEIGFKVNLKVVSPETDMQENLKTDDYSVTSMSWIADFADPVAMLELFNGSSTLNDSGWNDQKFDDLLSKASQETDWQQRYKTLSQAEIRLLESNMIIPLSYGMSLNVIDTSEIAGWYPNALDVHPFKFIEFKTKELAPGFI